MCTWSERTRRNLAKTVKTQLSHLLAFLPFPPSCWMTRNKGFIQIILRRGKKHKKEERTLATHRMG